MGVEGGLKKGDVASAWELSGETPGSSAFQRAALAGGENR